MRSFAVPATPWWGGALISESPGVSSTSFAVEVSDPPCVLFTETTLLVARLVGGGGRCVLCFCSSGGTGVCGSFSGLVVSVEDSGPGRLFITG
jgi:hypothetical protein